jgi:S1-C subfamily serine protease
MNDQPENRSAPTGNPMSDDQLPTQPPTQPPTSPPLFDDTVPAGMPSAPNLPPGAPTPPSGWQVPPTWGSAPQGWPPPPAPPMAQAAETAAGLPPRPEYGQPTAPAYGQTPGPAYAPPAGSIYGQPGGPSYTQPPGAGYGQTPGAGGAGGGWNYGYPPAQGWGPPPATPKPPNVARRALAFVAILALVLASAGAGAAVSAAVHSNNGNTSVSTAPFGNGTGNGSSSGNNNPFGNGSGTGTGSGTSGNGSGLGNGLGLGNGSSTNTGGTAPAAIVSKVNPSVVDIYTTINSGGSQGEAAGTGMILTSSGEVLTNNHVIDGATSIRVVIVANGASHTAKVLGYDVVDDVALIKIDNVSDLTPVSVADASSVQIGDAVVAIGNAGGRGGAPIATTGAVTALDQKVTAGDAGTGDSETLHGMIQISAPIEPGDSGGPLVDSDGDVIGMNTAAAQSDDFSGQSGNSTAFAIPIEKARAIVDQIRAGKDSDTVHVGDRGILGVQVNNVGQGGTSVPVSSGAAIAAVEAGGPASDAGIASGDVITSVDGKTVTNASDLTSLMFPYHPGDGVGIGWVDASGGTHHATVHLVAGPPA